MSMPTLVVDSARPALGSRLADYLELTRPKIALLVLVTVAMASFVAGWGPPSVVRLLHTLLGTALVAASASALNQWLERRTDALMQRTADRPLPAGRLSPGEVARFGAATIALGLAYLALAVNLRTALFGLASWICYVWLYTPLKSRTTANTWVGAVAGALPVLIGWAAVEAPLDLRAFALTLVVFLWQFPHFMAIAWIYRREYAAAGARMLPVVDPSGRRAGALAVVAALALIPVSLVPGVWMLADELSLFWTLALGAGQLACAVWFLAALDERSARGLLRASLVYLPAVMLLWMLGPLP